MVYAKRLIYTGFAHNIHEVKHMTIAFFRSIIIYFVVVAAVRIMGKRQIGELKPHELVMTVLVSQIATIPMEDNSMPLLNSLVPLLTLVACEVLVSVVGMKNISIRNLFQGKPIIIIKKGVIDQKQLKRLRFSVDDLVDALRQKDIFDINDVDYAIIEANGSISVLPKFENRPVTAKMLNIPPDTAGMPVVVVMDGKPVNEYFGDHYINLDFLDKELKKRNINLGDIFMMSVDYNQQYTIIKKDNEK